MLVDPPCHVDKIKEIAQRNDENIREFDEIYNRKFDIEETKFETMMEKVVILSHMFSLEFQKFVKSGNGGEILEHMWDGHYSDHCDNIYSAFARINQPYKDQLQHFWFGELERVKDTVPCGRRFIEPYEDCM